MLLALFLAVGAFASQNKPGDEYGIPGIQVVPVDSTAEPDHVKVILEIPEEDSIKEKNPVSVEMRLKGYPIGTGSDFPRKKEIWNDPKGQSMHIFIDNEQYFTVYQWFVNALDNNEPYYDLSLDFEIPFKLKPGAHVIRAFPVRSYNESLKGDGCFVARVFYYQKKEPLKNIDLSEPYLTYNEPQDDYDFPAHQPILLDFYVTNCQLSRDGYKVVVYIDEHKERVLTQWGPCYIYGLKQGPHKVRLQLIDPNNKPVPGLFNDVTRIIRLK